MGIKEDYNIWAASYDSEENKTRDLDKVVSQKLFVGRRFKKTLELGCGTGKNTVWLAELSDKIVAVDFSENMISIAKQKVYSSDILFIQANILDSWEPLGSDFNLISINLVLEHIQDLESIMKKCSAHLAKDGVLYISELHPYKQYNGSKARFECGEGTKALETHIHHISEYLLSAKSANLTLLDITESFDTIDVNPSPRLLNLLFSKA